MHFPKPQPWHSDVEPPRESLGASPPCEEAAKMTRTDVLGSEGQGFKGGRLAKRSLATFTLFRIRESLNLRLSNFHYICGRGPNSIMSTNSMQPYSWVAHPREFNVNFFWQLTAINKECNCSLRLNDSQQQTINRQLTDNQQTINYRQPSNRQFLALADLARNKVRANSLGWST